MTWLFVLAAALIAVLAVLALRRRRTPASSQETASSPAKASEAFDHLGILNRSASMGARRHVFWDSIVGAYRIQTLQGLQVVTSEPPYAMFLSATDPGLADIVAEFERRGLQNSEETVSAAWNRLLAQRFESELAGTFPGASSEAALRILDQSPYTLNPRLRLALLKLSEGDLSKLETWSQTAARDPRDALSAAWY